MLLKIVLIIFTQLLLAAAGFPICVFFVVFCRQDSHIEESLETSDVISSEGGVLSVRYGGDIIHGREVCITAADGTNLKADYLERGGDKTVIFVHGYRANPVKNFSAQCISFLDRGYDVLFVYQRAHGKSGGKFCCMGCRESDDVLRWALWAEENTCGNIVIYGTSMGAAALAGASENLNGKRVKALVCDCGFTCFYDEMDSDLKNKRFSRFMVMPVITVFSKLFLKIDIKKSAEISLAENRIPTAFIIGKNDKTVPPEIAVKNYTACAAEKVLIDDENSEHARAFEKGGKKIEEELFKFIDKFAEVASDKK